MPRLSKPLFIARRSALLLTLTTFIVLLHSAPLMAQISYSGVDRATVRVLAMGQVDLVDVELKDDRTIQLASPIGGHGSGFIVGPDLVVTAAHVVEGARAVAVHVPGVLGAIPAQVVYADSLRDYAFLRVAHPLPPAPELGPPGEPLSVRQPVFALGYPLDPTRTDPQSSQGVVAGLLPTGELQLGMSVNPGNSGGPVIDDKDRVHGILVARGNIEQGIQGLALAVPLASFRVDLERLLAETYDGQALKETKVRQIADLVSLMAHEGSGMMSGSVDIGSAESKRRGQQLLSLYKQLHSSPDATMLVAAFMWNRHVAQREKGKKYQGSLSQAVRLVKKAAKLDRSIAIKSAFARHILGNESVVAEKPDSAPPFRLKRKRVSPNGKATILFESEVEGATLYRHTGTSTGAFHSGTHAISMEIDDFERLCMAPCEAELAEGGAQFGIGIPGASPVRVARPIQVEDGVTLNGSFESNAGVRGAGWVVMIGGSLVGALVASTAFGCDDPEEVACVNEGALYGGLGLSLGSILAGYFMIRVQDAADIEIVSWGGGESAALPASRRVRIALPAPAREEGLLVRARF